MNKEFLKMQKLAGLITENQFKQLNELDSLEDPQSDDPSYLPLSADGVVDFIDQQGEEKKAMLDPETWEQLKTVEYWESDFPDELLAQFADEYPDAYRLSDKVREYISNKAHKGEGYNDPYEN
jgi:hypothetical protein